MCSCFQLCITEIKIYCRYATALVREDLFYKHLLRICIGLFKGVKQISSSFLCKSGSESDPQPLLHVSCFNNLIYNGVQEVARSEEGLRLSQEDGCVTLYNAYTRTSQRSAGKMYCSQQGQSIYVVFAEVMKW